MDLTEEQKDALTELFNIGAGRAAGALNELIGMEAELNIPDVAVVERQGIASSLNINHDAKLALVAQDFKCSFFGKAALVMTPDNAAKIFDLIVQREGSESSDEAKKEMLIELGNLLINGLLGSLGNALGQVMDYSVPVYSEHSLGDVSKKATPSEVTVVCKTNFKIKSMDVEGFFLMFIDIGAVDTLLQAINENIKGL